VKPHEHTQHVSRSLFLLTLKLRDFYRWLLVALRLTESGTAGEGALTHGTCKGWFYSHINASGNVMCVMIN
jgi:hypothetical protein